MEFGQWVRSRMLPVRRLAAFSLVFSMLAQVGPGFSALAEAEAGHAGGVQLGGAVTNNYQTWQPDTGTWVPGNAAGYTEGDVAAFSVEVTGVDVTVSTRYFFYACFDYTDGAGKFAFIDLQPWDTFASPAPTLRGGPISSTLGAAATDWGTIVDVTALPRDDGTSADAESICATNSLGYEITLETGAAPAPTNFHVYFGAQLAAAGLTGEYGDVIPVGGGVGNWPFGTFQAFLQGVTGKKTVNFKPTDVAVPPDVGVEVTIIKQVDTDGDGSVDLVGGNDTDPRLAGYTIVLCDNGQAPGHGSCETSTTGDTGTVTFTRFAGSCAVYETALPALSEFVRWGGAGSKPDKSNKSDKSKKEEESCTNIGGVNNHGDLTVGTTPLSCTVTNEGTVIAPVITVVKDADGDDADTTFEDPEGSGVSSTVTHRVQISNTSTSDATIDSIVDDKVGAPLTSADGTDLDCATVIGTTIAAGATVTCFFDGTAPSDDNDSLTATATVTVSDDDGNSDTKSNSSTVTTPDIAPDITVQNDNDANGDATFSDTEQAAARGATVTFNVTITNNTHEDVTIDSIGDDLHDATAVAGSCDDLLTTTLAANSWVGCTYTGTAPSDDNDSLTGTATVTVSDDDGNSDTKSDTSTVTTPDLQSDTSTVTTPDIAPPAIDTPPVGSPTAAPAGGPESSDTTSVTLLDQGRSEETGTDPIDPSSGVVSQISPSDLTWHLPSTLVGIVPTPVGALLSLLEVLAASIDALVIPTIAGTTALFGSSLLLRRRALHLGLPSPQPPPGSDFVE